MMIPFLLHIRPSELTIRNLASIIETKALVPRITNNASLFLPHGEHSRLHRRTHALLTAPRHVRRVIGLLLARRATRRRYVQQKRYVWVFFYESCARLGTDASRSRSSGTTRVRILRGRRVIFRDVARTRAAAMGIRVADGDAGRERRRYG